MARRSRVVGVNRLRRKLRRVPEAMRAPIRAEMEYAAKLIEAEMLARVPVDTGNLASLIRYKVSRDGLGARIGFLGKRAARKAFYAKFVEFGTRGYTKGEHRRTRGSKTTKVLRRNVPARPARPFMTPAYEAALPFIRDRIRRAVNRVLRDVARG